MKRRLVILRGRVRSDRAYLDDGSAVINQRAESLALERSAALAKYCDIEEAARNASGALARRYLRLLIRTRCCPPCRQSPVRSFGMHAPEVVPVLASNPTDSFFNLTLVAIMLD